MIFCYLMNRISSMMLVPSGKGTASIILYMEAILNMENLTVQRLIMRLRHLHWVPTLTEVLLLITGEAEGTW